MGNRPGGYYLSSLSFKVFIALYVRLLGGYHNILVLRCTDTFSQGMGSTGLTGKGFWLPRGGRGVIAAYVGYKMTDVIPLYARDVLDFTEVASARLGSVALWVRPFFALLAGYLAYRIKGSQIVALFFLVNLLFSACLSAGIAKNEIIAIGSVFFLIAGVFGIRGIHFALVNESNIPYRLSGTAIGVLFLFSIIGLLAALRLNRLSNLLN